MLNGHGDDIHAYGKNVVSNFSSNIYNGTDMLALEAHLGARTGLIRSYPEPDARSLAGRLAKRYGIGDENLCVTNGATEAIYLIAQAFRGARTAIVTPTFSEYEDACRAHGLSLSFVPENKPFPEDTELLWLCNPNNPTGKAYDKKELGSWIKNHPGTVVVIDQSYSFFTGMPGFTPTEAVKYPNLIGVHSLTKQYAIPGLRLGYLTACEELAGRIGRFRMPWSVNALAQEAGHFLLDHPELPGIDPEAYRTETERFRKRLSAIPGLTVYPTDTHFFLCRLEDGTASDLKKHLVDKHGILIRDASNFHGLDRRYFRLATQTAAENDGLTEAIKTWIRP